MKKTVTQRKYDYRSVSGRRMQSTLIGEKWDKEGKVTRNQLRMLLFKFRNK